MYAGSYSKGGSRLIAFVPVDDLEIDDDGRFELPDNDRLYVRVAADGYFAEKMEALRVGDPTDETTEVGALVNEAELQ